MTPDRIDVRGLAFHACHGVLPWERTTPQPFTVDVTLAGDWQAAAARDDLTATVDYRAVARAAAAVLGGPPTGLIEALAERIATLLLAEPGVWEVTVTVHKPGVDLGVPCADVAVTVTRRPRRVVVLGLGASVGDRLRALQGALDDAHDLGLSITAVSPVYRTGALGGSDAAEYCNAVVLAASDLPPAGVLAVTAECEKRAWQRVRPGVGAAGGTDDATPAPGVRSTWGPRPLDIDILDIDGVTSADPRLLLPHPRALTRRFVLIPWLDLQPQATIGGVRLAEALAGLSATEQPVHPLAERLTLPGPQPAAAGRSPADPTGGPR